MFRFALPALAAGVACAPLAAAAEDTPIRWLSQSQVTSAQYPIETATMDAITESMPFEVQRSEFQALGINMGDGLRLVRSGTFDIASITVGLVAADDPFLEGIDLIGVSTTIPDLREVVNAYREAFNARMEERFGVTALAIWPFGSQIFFCNEPIETLDDLQGLKVRSYTASMSTLLENLGATPVTLAFPEVYPALQRGVASCGITSPTSANTGDWPEVTAHVLPLSVSGAVQAHVVNLDWWNDQPEEDRAALSEALSALEGELWTLAEQTNGEAVACTTGGPCESDVYGAYDLALVDISEDDLTRLRQIAADAIVSDWAERCARTYPECASVWNQTVGAIRGISVE